MKVSNYKPLKCLSVLDWTNNDNLGNGILYSNEHEQTVTIWEQWGWISQTQWYKIHIVLILVYKVQKGAKWIYDIRNKDGNCPARVMGVTRAGHHNWYNHDGVITHLEPDILECKIKWALGSITTNTATGRDGIPLELFQILKNDAVKVLNMPTNLENSAVATELEKVSFHSNLKERQCQRIITLLHNYTHLTC